MFRRLTVIALMCLILGAMIFASPLSQAPNPQTSLLPVSVGGRYGYIDVQGRLVIKPQFDWAGEFTEGRAPIKAENRFGFIDGSGRMVIKPRFDSVGEFSEGLAPVEFRKRWGYIDDRGRVTISLQFDSASRFSEGLAAFYKNRKMGFIDRNGRVAIRPNFIRAFDFSEGLAVVVTEQERFAFINHSGDAALPLEFEYADSFHDGMARIGLHRPSGEIAVEVIDRRGNILTRLNDGPVRIHLLGSFSEGLAVGAVAGQNGFGYIDIRGDFAIKPHFDFASPFSDGLAAVRIGRNFGYVDRTGTLVISPKFDSAGPFKNGIARVTVREREITKAGYIDRRGQYVWPPTD